VTIWMPVEPEANELLSRSPLALLIAMLHDQQVTLEKAFAGPLDELRLRGSLSRGRYPVPRETPREQVTARSLPLPSRRSNAETPVPPA